MATLRSALLISNQRQRSAYAVTTLWVANAANAVPCTGSMNGNQEDTVALIPPVQLPFVSAYFDVHLHTVCPTTVNLRFYFWSLSMFIHYV